MDNGQKLSPIFNALSGMDKGKLWAVTGLKTMTDIVHEDTKLAPWKFPLYLGYVGFIAAPIPIPGFNVVPMGLLFGWYALGLTGRARWARGHIREKFQQVNIVNDNQPFIVPDPADPKKYRVRSIELVKDGNRVMWRDMKDSGKIFMKSVRDYMNN